MTGSALQNHKAQLAEHLERLRAGSIADLFKQEPSRFDAMSVRFDSLLFDFSKNLLDANALDELCRLADSADLAAKRDAMFRGDRINSTEDRAVLHTVLRNPGKDAIIVDGLDVTREVADVLNRMTTFAKSVRDGSYSVTGGKVHNVINIGIGGSDLGPCMVAQALSPYADGPAVHFVSNVDGADLADTVRYLDPKTTLFIVASKTFTTQETMTNAHSARAWLEKAGVEHTGSHFVALSTNLEATARFGVPEERTFGFWDWVGGRYSVWSAIGLSVMLSIGPTRFREFLNGAYAMDEHFRFAEHRVNIPVLMALIGIWHRSVCDYPSYAMLPYDNRLARLPAWLQQLDMESNGKSVMLNGESVVGETGPIVFGEPGTNGQHAFYQLIHQGTEVIPCDFLIAASSHEPDLKHHHDLLIANCLAQSEALMRGRTLQEAGSNPHRVFSGNRPSNTLLYERLDPATLGMLLALYEHKVFVQGVIWGINSFDQWGVELGKELAKSIEPMITDRITQPEGNASTNGLLEWIFAMRRES